MSAQFLYVSPIGVGSVLRLKMDTCSTAKTTEVGNK